MNPKRAGLYRYEVVALDFHVWHFSSTVMGAQVKLGRTSDELSVSSRVDSHHTEWVEVLTLGNTHEHDQGRGGCLGHCSLRAS